MIHLRHTLHRNHHHFHSLSTLSTTPPITPWPSNLTSNHLNFLISRQKNPLLSLQILEFATTHHPNLAVSTTTYTSLITRLSRARHFRHLPPLLHHFKNPNFKTPETLFTTLINHYGVAGRPNDAVRTFIQIPNFNISYSARTFNCLLNALVINKEFDLVRLLFKNSRVKFNVVPNLISCNILVKALCKKSDLVNAWKLIDEMPSMGIIPNLVTYTTILSGYVKIGDLKGARKVFEEILGKGYGPDSTAYTCLIDGYCRVGEVEKAVRLMDEMVEIGVMANEVTYGVVIEAFCREKKGGEAMKLLVDMLEREMEGKRSRRECLVSEVLCGKVVDVLCEEGRVEAACEVWKKCLEKNVLRDDSVLSMLVHWLCKEGKVKDARELVSEFERKSMVPSLLTYNVLIEGLCEVGESSEVDKLLDDMVERGCKPNASSYNLLIKGFCKKGEPKEGMRILDEMLVKECSPTESTYRILIEGLSGSGLGSELVKLLSIIADQGGKLDTRSWNVILRGALADVDTGEILDRILPENIKN